jgi:lysozyme
MKKRRVPATLLFISFFGLAGLSQVEGTSSVPYRDIAGLLTVGVGHLLTTHDEIKGLYTKSEIDAFLRDDVRDAVTCVQHSVKVPVYQNEFDTLILFVYNVGCKAFTGSTLLKTLNVGHYDEVPKQLMRWTRAGGKVVKGLENRRKFEVKLWEAYY